MNINKTLLRIRNISKEIRVTTTEIKTLIPNKPKYGILISKIYQTHQSV